MCPPVLLLNDFLTVHDVQTLLLCVADAAALQVVQDKVLTGSAGLVNLIDGSLGIFVGVQAFNELVAKDNRVEKVILPLRDGLTLIRVKD